MRTKGKMYKLIAAVLISVFLVAGCKKEEKKEIGPEVGKWHAEIQLNDISDSMSEEDKAIIAMLAGNTMFEVDVEFTENNAFTYVMNTDKLEEEISNSFTTLFSFFMDFDVSVFIEHLVEAALQDALPSANQDYAGTYSKSKDDIITATDGGNLYFKINGNSLIQIDEEGNEFIKLSKVS